MLVRQVVTGLGEAIELDAADLNDITTAVTEACNNVVLHAYDGQEGPLEVDVQVTSESVAVAVRDRGRGIAPPFAASQRAGMGLSVIEALALSSEFRGLDDGGTEVRMTFSTPAPHAPGRSPGSGAPPAAPSARDPESALEMAIAPASLAGGILPRLVSALGARVHFETDRLADLVLAADAIAARAPEAISDGHLTVGVSLLRRHLELRLSPLRPGGAALLLGDDAGGLPVLARLSAHRDVTPAEGSDRVGDPIDEMLTLQFEG
jgi:serine/threonine-protein kinase RsbW